MSAGRQYLTDAEWKALFEAQGGLCACGCGSTGPFHADHSNPNFFAPGKPDQLLAVPCHKRKTREQDAPAIARANRLAGVTETQYERRKRLKAEGKYRPMSRLGFSSNRPRSAEDILRGSR